MRKFRLINGKGYKDVEEGHIYREDHMINGNTVRHLFYDYPEDWEEVFKTKHKDTDLGYFTGIAIKATNLQVYTEMYGNKWASKVSKDAVLLAKSLIKELDKEVSDDE